MSSNQQLKISTVTLNKRLSHGYTQTYIAMILMISQTQSFYVHLCYYFRIYFFEQGAFVFEHLTGRSPFDWFSAVFERRDNFVNSATINETTADVIRLVGVYYRISCHIPMLNPNVMLMTTKSAMSHHRDTAAMLLKSV